MSPRKTRSQNFFSITTVLVALLVCLTAFSLVRYDIPQAVWVSPQMQRVFRNAHQYARFVIPSPAFVGAPRSLSTNMPSLDSVSTQPLALPETASDDTAKKLDLSGEGSSVSLDHLGPMVVNQDGTLSRISNWDKMSEIEQKNTMRVIGKRNKQRLEALKQNEQKQAHEATEP